ncbi:glutamate 5-kinase [Stomatohabitans albus]|uniref:glutamate 5-kinase n=1 Tax=Stomatohabitans albus TaxID=3110766 RepID=UPI00300C0A1B
MHAPRLTKEQAHPAVVKVGSSSLTLDDGNLNQDAIRETAKQVAQIKESLGRPVVLVTSGAVAAGFHSLGFAERPSDTGWLQASASVGQGYLMHAWESVFTEYGQVVGQVLLSADDLLDRRRYLNARTTLTALLSCDAIPIVNENDAVVTDELRLGDNDRLAALTASMLDASMLVLLTDVDGVHNGPPSEGHPLIPVIDDLTALDERHFGRSGSRVGSGGMASKLEAARIGAASGLPTVIANAKRPNVIVDALAGKPVGTVIPPFRHRTESSRLWRAFAHPAKGQIVIDDGAVDALVNHGASLLAVGIKSITGAFPDGSCVQVLDTLGKPVARGRARCGAVCIDDMLTSRSPQGVIIHRDDLVVLRQAT